LGELRAEFGVVDLEEQLAAGDVLALVEGDGAELAGLGGGERADEGEGFVEGAAGDGGDLDGLFLTAGATGRGAGGGGARTAGGQQQGQAEGTGERTGGRDGHVSVGFARKDPTARGNGGRGRPVGDAGGWGV